MPAASCRPGWTASRWPKRWARSWSLATRPLAEQMNASSAMVAHEVNEFELAKLTPAASQKVAVPRVAESPVSFECRLTQIVRLEDVNGTPMNNWLVLGEVVGIYIAKHLLKDGIYDTPAAEPILRGGGAADYFTVTPENRFKMYRPR
jgi:flavin reductase (DIM6/NTAB) family NADH-FMN oxidoreductase RutF